MAEASIIIMYKGYILKIKCGLVFKCISAGLNKCVTRPGLSIPDSDLGLTQVEFQPPVSHKTKTFRLFI